MNFDAFSHGQIQSKIWLCEELEPHTPIHANIRILGSWYNILAFMLLTRRPEYYYNSIEGIDIDPDAMTPREALEALYKLKSIAKEA